jgi:hypothetical protein
MAHETVNVPVTIIRVFSLQHFLQHRQGQKRDYSCGVHGTQKLGSGESGAAGYRSKVSYADDDVAASGVGGQRCSHGSVTIIGDIVIVGGVDNDTVGGGQDGGY